MKILLATIATFAIAFTAGWIACRVDVGPAPNTPTSVVETPSDTVSPDPQAEARQRLAVAQQNLKESLGKLQDLTDRNKAKDFAAKVRTSHDRLLAHEEIPADYDLIRQYDAIYRRAKAGQGSKMDAAIVEYYEATF